ncbi:hypothetical protein EQP59_00085 [Ornithobacterium rhinotracheale]|uniref:Antimicrobial peptide, SdpC family n=1 Tax=Ornithobacterium rhinotracheale TaxID=28251 RepID=A0A410JNY4_ORNRH|nr:hypothetical protein [Ornithobacterium rhinotracheale]QAR29870.1 hypothetical protein EQP59_00085 [Ornithobacterium rhinotracheale]
MKAKLILSILSFIFLISCSNDDSQANDSLILKNEKELFSEIFFGNVPNNRKAKFQTELTSFKSTLNQNQLKQLNDVENLVMDNISKIDPSFFSKFNEEITSGDHIRIRNEMEKSVNLLEKASLNVPEIAEGFALSQELISEIDLAEFKNSDGSINIEKLNNHIEYKFDNKEVLCGPTFCFAFGYIAAGVSIALVVNYAVAVSVYKYAFGPKREKEQFSPNGHLKNEILIDKIAKSYAL